MRVRLLLFGLSLVILMSSLDTSIVNVALPALVRDLNTTFVGAQWVVLSYLLVVTSLIVGVGRLGDLVGKKRLFLGGLVIFTVASAFCGLAISVWMLVAARALQGLGAAVLMALGFAIAQEVVPRERIGRTMGFLSGMVALGFALGPSLGGALLDLFGWPSIFYVNIPFGVLAVVVLARFLPAPSSAPRAQQRFDWGGTLLLALTLAAYTSAMTLGEQGGPLSKAALSLLTVAGLSLVAFLALERRISSPLLVLGMFRDRLLSSSLLVSVLVYTAMMSALMLPPFFLSRVMGLSNQQVGLLMSVGPLITAVFSMLAGTAADRFGARSVMFVGLVTITFGCVWMSTVDAGSGALGFGLRIGTMNMGLAFFQTPNNTAVMTAANPAQRGVVSGLLSLSRTLGLTTGASVMGAIFAAFVAAGATTHADVASASPAALTAGMNGVFRIAAGMVALAAVLTALATRRRVDHVE